MRRTNTIFQNKIIKQLLSKYENIWALEYLSGIAQWDLNVYMPKLGSFARGKALGKTATLIQQCYLDKELKKLIKQAQNQKTLNDYEKGVI
jgi:carboxypeptidase Taq